LDEARPKPASSRPVVDVIEHRELGGELMGWLNAGITAPVNQPDAPGAGGDG
jgi:hypothetical protein